MGNVIGTLKKYVYSRRQDASAASRARSDHPERLHPDQISAEEESQSIVTKPIKVNTGALATKCSDFYMACRLNNIGKVKRFLQTITLEQIDRIEPNGSTALHAASYHGHRDIVKLLLEAGADRAIHNKFQCLPFDEAADDEIKDLFLRIPNTNRFVSNTGAIEWELINDDVLETAAEERHYIRSLFDNASGLTPIGKMFQKIETNYVDKALTNFRGIDHIKRFFRKATEEQDPIWIIKAYTAETEFYQVLNREIAGGATQYQNERRYIIALLCHHPQLNPLSYTGLSYRVMEINSDDLKKYEIKSLLMSKAFLSSSIDRQITELFLYRKVEAQTQNKPIIRVKQGGKFVKSWIMCIYHIKDHRTALHIENSSQYANEGEVLIMPYTVFKVKAIENITSSSLPKGCTMTQIQFEECEQFFKSSKGDA